MEYDRKDPDFDKSMEKVYRTALITQSQILHVVVTHFNIKFAVPHKGRDIKRTWKRPLMKESYAKEYMRSRISLFRDFCYPSMLNQSCQNFHWFVYLDGDNTPSEWFSEFDRITPVYLKENDVFSYKKHLAVEIVRRRLTRDKKWVIFTKLDNDDCLEKHWINELQTMWLPLTKNLGRNFSLLNFNDGLMFIKRGQDKYLFNHKDRHNPFVNTIERITSHNYQGDMVTCWKSTHNQMLGTLYSDKVIRVTDPNRPMFLINDQQHNLCDRNDKINTGKKTKKSLDYIEENFGVVKECLE